TFNEAWERFKDLLRQCPHHGFSELHQWDTFYNALNPNDHDALDSAAGGNFLDKIPRESVGNFIQNRQNVSNQTRPPGFHQPTQQNNNQNRFQGNNLNQNRPTNQGAIYQNRPPQNPNLQASPQQNTADFVILDFVADPRVPLILGRPFLSTAHAIINVFEREIIIRYNQQSLTIQCSDILSVKKIEQINKIEFINAGGIDFESEEIEDFLNDESI
nr:reverse transcriptase domain-containing protein [Tanacetum cinerariifolium]